MKRIRWAPAAAYDLEHIDSYLREHYPSRALATVRKLYEAARSLKRLPNRGRIGQREGTRELIVSPLPYLIVHIFRILHTSENRP